MRRLSPSPSSWQEHANLCWAKAGCPSFRNQARSYGNSIEIEIKMWCHRDNIRTCANLHHLEPLEHFRCQIWVPMCSPRHLSTAKSEPKALLKSSFVAPDFKHSSSKMPRSPWMQQSDPKLVLFSVSATTLPKKRTNISHLSGKEHHQKCRLVGEKLVPRMV